MARWSTGALAVIAAAGALTSAILYRRTRALEDELARARPAASADPWSAPASTPSSDAPAAHPVMMPRLAAIRAAEAPRLTPAPEESRLERRARRQREVAAMLGRLDGETDDEYRARLMPMLTGLLAKPRKDVEDLRAQVEAKAQVTPEQHARLDAAFGAVYDDVVAYTNSAIADGQLSPYDRNVAGMLQYAGGLGTILEGAEGKVSSILSPDQAQAIHDSGFEWGEYLGTLAPWERLQPPPLPRP